MAGWRTAQLSRLNWVNGGIFRCCAENRRLLAFATPFHVKQLIFSARFLYRSCAMRWKGDFEPFSTAVAVSRCNFLNFSRGFGGFCGRLSKIWCFCWFFTEKRMPNFLQNSAVICRFFQFKIWVTDKLTNVIVIMSTFFNNYFGVKFLVVKAINAIYVAKQQYFAFQLCRLCKQIAYLHSVPLLFRLWCGRIKI